MPVLDRDGVRLVYTDHGGPERPAMVLVHGWCDQSATMSPLAEAFTASHRVVRVDLRGHGGSDAPLEEADYAITTLADDVAALCEHLGVRTAVLLGHSLGGAVAVELAARRPDLVTAVVALEGTILFPDEARSGGGALVDVLRTPAWRDAMRGVLESAHLPTDDPGVLRGQLAELDRLPQHVVAACAAQALAWDAEQAVAALGAAGTPVLYVEATGGLADLKRFASLCPQLAVGRVVAVGHNQLLATPAQAVAMIERLLETALARPPVDNLTPVHELFHALEAGDLGGVERWVAADFVDHGAPEGRPQGPAGYRALLETLRSALQARWEPLDEVTAGGRVALRVRFSGRHVGALFGLPPTGREFTIETMHLYRVEDGVIREHWAVRDDLGLYRQLGFVDAPAAGAAVGTGEPLGLASRV